MNVYILCGGMGKRMGYVNKGKLRLCGKSFVDILIDELSSLGKVRIVGRKEDFEGYEALEDFIEGIGPLGGILRALYDSSSERLLVVPCDTPLFSKKIAEYMIEHSEGYEIVAFHLERVTPIPGIYSKDLFSDLLSYANSGRRSITDFVLSRKTLLIHPRTWRYLRGVNTPEDYEALKETFKCR